MKRNLSETDYGTLATIISLITFPALLGSAIVPIVVRYAGNYFATGQLHMARGLYLKIAKFFLIIDILFFIIMLIFIPQLDTFFHFTNPAIMVITDLIIFLGLMGVINMAFIQAKLAFMYQSVLSSIASAIKLVLGVLFVSFGINSLAGGLAILISSIYGYLAGFWPFRFIFDKKMTSPHIESKELFAYGIPSSLVLFGQTALISTDIILVKHFYNPEQAGIYAGLSLLGKVIFYFSAPIGSVMFPLIVQKHSRQENVSNIFLLSLLFILIPSVGLTVFYFLFPKFTILFFTGKKEDLVVIPVLGMFGIFLTLYSVLNIMCNFYLSIKKTRIYIPVLTGAVLQCIFIFLYHRTFFQIILISLAITFLLVLSLLLYYPYTQKSASHD